MESVKRTVQSINSYAQVQPSTFSNVNLDFVLNTGSYTTINTTSNTDDATNTITAGTTFNLLQCIPCEPDLAESDNKRRLFNMLEQTASNAPHSVNNMKTHYLRLPGRFHLKKLEVLLDALLYGGSGGASHGVGSGVAKANANIGTATTSTGAIETAGMAVPVPATTATSTSNDTTTMNIFRMKGIIRTSQSDTLYVLQAVHNIFDLQPSTYSVGDAGDMTKGDSVLVIIGKNLDMELVEAEFRKCLE
jgi:G3E family GTPase